MYSNEIIQSNPNRKNQRTNKNYTSQTNHRNFPNKKNVKITDDVFTNTQGSKPYNFKSTTNKQTQPTNQQLYTYTFTNSSPKKNVSAPKKQLNSNLNTNSNSGYTNLRNNRNLISNDGNYDLQSEKIIELQNYKNLCEQYIKNNFPNQSLPLTMEDISNNDIVNHQYDTYSLSSTSPKNKDFDTIQREHQELIEELKKQHVQNDQQRNYIQILKQSLESNLVRNGLKNLVNRPVNEVLDFAKISENNIELQNELNKNKMEMTELNNEIKELKKSNEDLVAMANMLKNKYELEKGNNDAVNKKLENKLKVIDESNQNVENLKNENNELKSNLNDFQALCNKYEMQIFDNGRKINELTNEIDMYKSMEKKYDEVNNCHIKLKYENDNLNQDIKSFEQQLNSAKENNEKLKKEKKDIKNEMQQKEEKYLKEKQKIILEKEKAVKNLLLKENEEKKFNSILSEKENEIRNLKENEVQFQKEKLQLETEKEQLDKEFLDYKTKSEIDNEIQNKKLQDNQLLIENLKRMLTRKETECKTSEDTKKYSLAELTKAETQNKILTEEKNALINDVKNLETNLKSKTNELQDALDTLKKIQNENDALRKELPNVQKAHKQETQKNEEIITNCQRELHDLYAKLKEYEEILQAKDREQATLQKENQKIKSELEENLSILYNEKQQNEKMSRSITQRNQEKVLLNEKLEELSKSNANHINHIKNLESNIQRVLQQKTNCENELEDTHNKFHNMIKQVQDDSDLKSQQLINMTDNINSIYTVIQRDVETILNFINQILTMPQDKNFYSSNFNKKMRNFYEYLNQNKNRNHNSISFSAKDSSNRNNNEKQMLGEQLEIIGGFLNEICSENMVWNNLINELNEENDKLKVQLNSFSNNIQNKDDLIEQNELAIQKINEDNTIMKLSNDKLLNRISNQDKQIQELLSNIQLMNQQNKKMENDYNQLLSDVEQHESNLKNKSYHIEALEERVVLLNKEKKLCSDILEKICNGKKFLGLSNLVRKILNICDEMFLLERDKIKKFYNNFSEKELNEKLRECQNNYDILFNKLTLEVNNSDDYQKNLSGYDDFLRNSPYSRSQYAGFSNSPISSEGY